MTSHDGLMICYAVASGIGFALGAYAIMILRPRDILGGIELMGGSMIPLGALLCFNHWTDLGFGLIGFGLGVAITAAVSSPLIGVQRSLSAKDSVRQDPVD